MDIKELIKTLKENSQVQNIEPMENYMRNQFKFLGIKSVKRRELSKDFIRNKKAEIDWDLVFNLWELEEREFQYIACDYLIYRKKLLELEHLKNLRRLIITKSWWGTVDNLSPLVGEIFLKYPEKRNVLLDWSKDENIWIKRASILSQLKYKENTDIQLLIKIIKNNLGTDEFFINKGIGWILREYSKTNPDFVRNFIKNNNDKLDKLTLREGSKYI